MVVDEVEVLPSEPPQRPTSVPQALQQNMPLASVSLPATHFSAIYYAVPDAVLLHAKPNMLHLLQSLAFWYVVGHM